MTSELSHSDHLGAVASDDAPAFTGRGDSGHAARSEAPSLLEVPELDDWAPLVRAAGWSTLLALVAKVVSLIWITQRVGASIRILKWRDLIPYVSFQTNGEQFTQMVTVSSLVMALVSSVGFAVAAGWTAARHRSARPKAARYCPGRVAAGWYFGVFVTVETWAIEGIRQLIHPPILRLPQGYWTLLPLLVANLLAVVYYVLDRRNQMKSRRSATAITQTSSIHGITHSKVIRGEAM